MRLKRLELYGYKSFATRTVFEFGEGISAIVGPNGSGKSNVADAVRWVMGEQSYRSLRAQTTEDMIFAGSGRRARLGMAEAIVTLDNADGWLPIDFAEVTLGRRAHRSGENEYLLNGQRVRYRDVLDLLESGGLARTSYAVIGQGLVDAALALRPEARRVLFEEAAGVAPLLRKREEALERIAETERNLQRVADILSEMQPRTARLRRQAERAEEYLLLNHDLQELQRIWYGYQWHLRNQQVAESRGAVTEAEQRLESQRTYARQVEAEHAALLAAQSRVQRDGEALAAQQANLRVDGETWRRELAVADERFKLYSQQAQSLDGEMQALEVRAAQLQKEIERASADLSEQETGQAAAQRDLESLRAELQRVDLARAQQTRQAAGLQSQANQLIAQAAELHARLDQLRERKAALNADRQKAQSALAELDTRGLAAEAEGRSLTEKEQAQLRLLGDHESARTQVEQRVADLKAEVAAAESAARVRRAECDRLAARRDLLGRLRQDLTGYFPGVRDVLSPGSDLHGLLGTVATLMEVPAELEAAIESALGPRLQHVVAQRWEDAEAAIAHLKHTRSGWATFLPLDTLKTRPALDVASQPHVRGVASQLVRFDPVLKPVFDLLLGTTLVVDDLTTARVLLSERGVLLIVTLEGDTVQPSGALSGGVRQQGANLLAQEREWRALQPLVDAAEADLQGAEEALSAAVQAQSEAQRALTEHELRQRTLRSAVESARAALAQHAQTLRELGRDRQWRASLLAQANRDLEQNETRTRAAQAQLDTAQQQQLEVTAQLRELQRQIDAARDEGLRQKLGELETRASLAQRALQSQRALLASHRDNLAQIVQQSAGKSVQRADCLRLMADMEKQRADCSEHLRTLDERLTALAAQAQPLAQESARLSGALPEAEKQRGQVRDRLSEAQLALDRASLERERSAQEQSALAREIEEQLGPVDLPTEASHQLRLTLGDDVVALPAVESLPPTLEGEVRALKGRVRRLGAVNLDAPHEYEQLIDRETFLQGQDADLRGAIASLHEVIGELDARIDSEFGATFRAVSVAFADYFETLFTGGRGRLVLTDPDDVNNTGVDIVVHLPGKRAENLSLLSGGERALTAVALLFALLKANPVPFCFLDEVDAALDEVNVRRFRQLLQEHAHTTQFVVITHNRHTMEAASTIYGISMGEQGVSQCVSLQLAAAVEQMGLPNV